MLWLGLTSIKSWGRLPSQSVIFIKALPLRSLSPSATHGKWRRLSWQWFGLHAISGWLLSLLSLTMLWLYWQPQPWAPVPSLTFPLLPPSLGSCFLTKYGGWICAGFFFFFKLFFSSVMYRSAHLGNLSALDLIVWPKWKVLYFSPWNILDLLLLTGGGKKWFT